MAVLGGEGQDFNLEAKTFSSGLFVARFAYLWSIVADRAEERSFGTNRLSPECLTLSSASKLSLPDLPKHIK